jgi:catechol 2,3-dioxygenase-like lactoylglutathione lyase family enzyme
MRGAASGSDPCRGRNAIVSTLFGPVVQQGYVVPDLRAAMQHWIVRGIGPFFYEELRGYPGLFRGEQHAFDLDAGFAFSGDQQIEVIQPLGDAPSIYRGFLRHHPTGGLQHLAVWVDDIDATLARLEQEGRPYVVAQRYGDRHAYLDSVDSPGVMIQLMAHTAANDELFRVIKEASLSWDGESNPIRRIDWSSGRPVAPTS